MPPQAYLSSGSKAGAVGWYSQGCRQGTAPPSGTPPSGSVQIGGLGRHRPSCCCAPPTHAPASTSASPMSASSVPASSAPASGRPASAPASARAASHYSSGWQSSDSKQTEPGETHAPNEHISLESQQWSAHAIAASQHEPPAQIPPSSQGSPETQAPGPSTGTTSGFGASTLASPAEPSPLASEPPAFEAEPPPSSEPQAAKKKAGTSAPRISATRNKEGRKRMEDLQGYIVRQRGERRRSKDAGERPWRTAGPMATLVT